MNSNKLPPFVVFGAADPEQETAERVCCQLGIPFGYAVGIDGKRVNPGRACAPTNTVQLPDGRPIGMMAVPKAILFECNALICAAQIKICDHHRPGDPGFGKPPAEFWQASSLGQLCEILRVEGYFGPKWKPMTHLLLCAAADHCLAAAYRGECPGVNPDTLMAWRAESRAAFQHRSVEAVIEDVEATTEVLRNAPSIVIGRRNSKGGSDIFIRDIRRDPPYPELPEAATRLGIGYIAGPIVDRDGRRKITCSGTPEQISAFLESWAPAENLTNLYGDPERGFAGGYLS